MPLEGDISVRINGYDRKASGGCGVGWPPVGLMGMPPMWVPDVVATLQRPPIRITPPPEQLFPVGIQREYYPNTPPEGMNDEHCCGGLQRLRQKRTPSRRKRNLVPPPRTLKRALEIGMPAPFQSFHQTSP